MTQRLSGPRRRWQRRVAAVAAIALFCALRVSAQTTPGDRTFHYSKTDVEKALRNMQAYAGGRLPTLEGFVEAGDRPLDRYQRGYYQYDIAIQVLSAADSRVRVTAKVTAWFTDKDPAQSGYQVLPSNGRLESDLLDRLEIALLGPAAKNPTPAHPTPLADSASGHGSSSSSNATPTPDPGAAAAPPEFVPRTPSFSLPPRKAPSSSAESAVNRHIQQLSEQEKSLQEILRSQAHPDNLACVRNPRTPVLARPLDGAQVLFFADAQDEFQVLGVEKEWVHVQVSGLSRGWIRAAQVEMPGSTLEDGKTTAPAELFHQAREETGVFPGKWVALQDRPVRIIWIQPNPDEKSSVPDRMGYIWKTLRKTYPELAKGEERVDGVVLVFDSADGGMAAATMATLQQWMSGKLSNDDFWKQCWFDPPEAFGASR